MKLEGVHHVTAITGDAPGNVDFYTRVLGLRLVKKSVNQDDPTVYHLFYGDEEGAPGNDITFFEYPGARPGTRRRRDGAPGCVAGRLRRRDLLLGAAPRQGRRADRARRERFSPFLRSRGPRARAGGLTGVRRAVDRRPPGDPGRASAPGLRGRARLHARPGGEPAFLEGTLEFDPQGEAAWEARGKQRGGYYRYDRSSDERGIPGAGTVHHVAWASPTDEHEAWQKRVSESGASPTPVIDRFYFKSIYFREPSGVLFEIATTGPGFTADEPLETLGEHLSLPPDYEPLRERLEQVLTPLPDPRAARAGK